MSKKLNELLAVTSEIRVDYLSEDSHDIKENTLFFCLQGAYFDGHNAIEEVIAKGAKVIVHTDEVVVKKADVYYYQSTDIAKDMALISTRFYDNPSHKMNLIGITGTNGKTTIAWLLADILNRITTCGYIGTIDIEYNQQVFKNLYTTPKAIELNYHLHQMISQNINNCALEVSSHALALKRTDFLKFKYAVMTNLTFEHVNYHGSMQAYAQAKRSLFEQLTEDAYALLNIDDLTYNDYAQATKAKVLSYGINNSADIMARNIKIEKKQTTFELVIDHKTYQITTNLIALFNVYNLLPVLAILYLEGYDFQKILPILQNVTLPKGRMEIIDEGQDFDVIIDYAHTPDGFEQVFSYAKEMAKGAIISVFGSGGGDRDKEKRSVLGEIADKYSDQIILTEEDVRNETTKSIALEIAQGIKNHDYLIIDSRQEAITTVINKAKKDDMILILAKADDNYLIVGNEALPYEGDLKLTRRLLKERMKKQ